MSDTSGAIALLALMTDCVYTNEFDGYFKECSVSGSSKNGNGNINDSNKNGNNSNGSRSNDNGDKDGSNNNTYKIANNNGGGSTTINSSSSNGSSSNNSINGSNGDNGHLASKKRKHSLTTMIQDPALISPLPVLNSTQSILNSTRSLPISPQPVLIPKRQQRCPRCGEYKKGHVCTDKKVGKNDDKNDVKIKNNNDDNNNEKNNRKIQNEKIADINTNKSN